MDAAWLQAYGENLDDILLNSLEGPWALWNEPVVDQLAIGFLELLVRVSPNKDYPVCLTDSVRKWMQFPMPLLLDIREKDKRMGRKNRKRWFIRFKNLNQRLLALNILWGGWSKAYSNNFGVHWECVEMDFKLLCRKILYWPSELLTVPASMSSFAEVTSKSGRAYTEINPGMIEVNEVRAEAVALLKLPPVILPILSLLPEPWKRKYEREEELVVSKGAAWREMRECRPKLGMKREEYIKVIKKLLELGMVTLLPIAKIKVINGLHCVTKDAGKQRLIFDGRPVNRVLVEPDKVSLPDFSLLMDWEIKSGERIRFGKLDLDNFYHRLGVPGWLVPYLGLPTINAKQLGGLEGVVCPACLTLPMGLSHSVLVAQMVHLFVLRNTSIAPQINLKIGPSTSRWAMLYIDDVIVAAKMQTKEEANKIVNSVLKECIAAYSQVGLIVNQNKLEWAAPEIMGLGCVFSEEKCGIRPKKERICQIIGATRYMLTLGEITLKSIESLLGHWTWFILLYRLLYAVFYHVYKWLHSKSDNMIRCLWKSVKREFSLVIIFADMCKLTWKRQTAPIALAMDASLKGAGACEIEWTEIKDGGGQSTEIALKDKGFWIKTLNRKWDRVEHINILEMRALTMALIPRVNKFKYFGMRWRIYSDSWVVVGAVRKGRSSSYMLYCLLRRLASICLTMDAMIILDWVASDCNPADVFSRVFSSRDVN